MCCACTIFMYVLFIARIIQMDIATSPSWINTLWSQSNTIYSADATNNYTGYSSLFQFAEISDFLTIPEALVRLCMYVDLDITQSKEHKARFIESGLFACAVLTFLSIAFAS
jgi:hypothetical protein